MSHSLLIAGVGYVGSELQRQALEAGWTVTGFSKSGGEGSLACDLSSRSSVEALANSLPPESTPTAIVHCASSGRGGADAYRAVFVDGTAHLLAAFPDVPLLFISSSSVYGQIDGSTVTESSPTEPDRETSRLLLEAEQAVLSSGGCVSRLAGIYGPGRSVILKRFLEGTAGIEDKGERILNQIHRDDAAAAIIHLLGSAPFPAREIFNIADSTPLSQGDCYRELATLFDRPLPPTVARNMNRKRAWTNKAVSNDKLLRSGWTPTHPNFLLAASAIAESLSSNGNA
jgi:nucleoside-diphosphate-sugar epimerase